MRMAEKLRGVRLPARLHTHDTASRRTSVDVISCLLFAAGFARFFSFDIGGYLFGSDILFVILFPIALGKISKATSTREVRLVLLLGVAWLFGAVLTDFSRGSPFADYSRGWAKIILLMFDFFSLAAISELRFSRLMSYFAGIATSMMLVARFEPNSDIIIDPWKFGYGLPITLLAMCVASTPFSNRATAGIMRYGLQLTIAAVNIFLGYRSLFGFAILAVMVTFFTDRMVPERTQKRISTGRITAIASAGAVAGFALISGYAYLAESGTLGSDARDKYEAQTSGNLGILLGGRSESLVSIQAIKDSPIIGHGSWARDMHYVYMYVAMMREKGYRADLDPNMPDLIPAHSYFFGSWVESGVLGAVFWLVCMVIAARAFLNVLLTRSVVTPFVSFTLMLFMWDILFSPFGASQRLWVSGELCIAIWALSKARTGKPSNSKRQLRIIPRYLLQPSMGTKPRYEFS